MMLFAVTLLLLVLLPSHAFAWGAGVHLQLGSEVIRNLNLINPAIAAVISEYPYDFLYGCVAADITIGKKFTHYLQHCHRWQVGMRVLRYADTDPRRACAYGYLTHLAADVVAHNFYVPFKVMLSFPSLTLKHAYWEMRMETFVEREAWELGKKVAQENYRSNDALLRQVISDTLFSFGTNKRIFNSIMLVSRFEKWQQVMKSLASSSRYEIPAGERQEFLGLAREAVFDYLEHQEKSAWYAADPTGEVALATAEQVRRNLRTAYREGRLTRGEATDQVLELKGRLRNSICSPSALLQILSDEADLETTPATRKRGTFLI